MLVLIEMKNKNRPMSFTHWKGTNITDTFRFLTKLSEDNSTNQTMVSVDIKNLFANIPTTYTTNLILDSIFSNGCTSWNGLNRNRLKKSITWSTQNTTF